MKQNYQNLYQLFAAVKSPKEAQILLADLLTPQELDSIAERWALVQLLALGLPQRAIQKKLKVSISKITRGSKELQYGHGGFKLMLNRLKPK